MSQPDWTSYGEERVGVAPPKIGRPRRSRKGLAGMLLAVACLIAMCRVPNWDGQDSAGLSAQEKQRMLMSPAPSESKRRALVLRVQDEALERIRVLRAVAADEGEASGDARTALRNLRDALGD